MKNFAKWTTNDVEKYFGIRQNDNHPALSAWLAATLPLTSAEESSLAALGDLVRQHVNDWNEEELKMKFLSLLLKIVEYDHEEYQAFFDRPLAAIVKEERLRGVVDCIIASGRREPERPFFCLREYKPERHSSNDPRGQLLAAMLVAHSLNQNEAPLYGAYIIGRQWFFVILDQQEYAVSLAYDATKPHELRQIFMALRFIKQIVESILHIDAK